jgi:hypothetical protein
MAYLDTFAKEVINNKAMKNKEKDTTNHTQQNEYTVNECGSLGLLAMGYEGLRTWREVRRQTIKDAQRDKAKKG